MDNTKPTQFAITRKYNNKVIFDLCCGNGRDTKYFGSTGNQCTGVDLLAEEITDGKNSIIKSGIKDFLTTQTGYVDVVYCRFGFHAFDEETEDFIIDWASKHAQELAIEVRIQGDVPVIFVENHYERRYADPIKLTNKLIKAGFNFVSCKTGHGMAKFGKEDSLIGRFIGRYE
jgi:SAM-dependent methyltransferase